MQQRLKGQEASTAMNRVLLATHSIYHYQVLIMVSVPCTLIELYVTFPWILSDSPTPPVGYFDITFVVTTTSRYSEKVTFRSTSQGDLLATTLEDVDRMHEIRDSLVDNPHFRIFSENPLQLGHFLGTISVGKLICISLSLLGYLVYLQQTPECTILFKQWTQQQDKLSTKPHRQVQYIAPIAHCYRWLLRL